MKSTVSAFVVFALTLIVALVSIPAHAQVCVDGTSLSCNGGGASALCTTSVCDLDKHGGTTAIEAYAIYYASANRHEVFGSDSTGTDFCCHISASGTFSMTGSAQGDTLSFHYDAGGGTTYDMEARPGTGYLDASINGEGGDDYIYGSEETAYSLLENLYGDAGIDRIWGGAGDDDLWGGADTDYLYGEDGEDYLRGGDYHDLLYGGPDDDYLMGDAGGDYLFGQGGDDLLVGGAGDDSLHGHAGNDVLIGEAGADFMEGDEGNDVLCGGTEVPGGTGLGHYDYLYGGSGNDVLWGMTAAGYGTSNDGAASDAANESSDYDLCDEDSWPGYDYCDGYIDSAPIECY